MLFIALLMSSFAFGQLSEGFETWPPADWTIVQGACSPTNDITQSSTNANTGTYSARFSSYSSCGSYDEYLITPQLSTTLGDESISFFYIKSSSGSEVFRVGWSSTGTNVATDFTWGTTITNASTTWQQYIKTDLPVGTKYVAIHYSSSYQYYLYIDDVAGPALGGVTNPASFVAAVASSTEIDLDWTLNVNSDNVMVAWSTDGVFGTPVNGTPYSASDLITGGGTVLYNGSLLHYDHSGLTENTQYYYQAWSVDGSSNYSSGIADDATTACDAIAILPFFEGFNSTSATQSCWTVLDENGDGDEWDLNYTTNPYEGDQVAIFNSDYNAGANDDYLISPAITLTGNERLKFWQRVQSAGEPNNFEVLLSTTGTAAADFTTVILPDTAVANTTYQEFTIDLSAYSGNVYIAWHIPPAGLDGWRLYIDAVTVEEIPATPIFTLDPVSADYGTVVAATSSADQVFTITNTGGGSLTILSGGITLTGTDAADFTLTNGNTYPINLGVAESTTVSVAFTPTTEGTKSAELNIVHNATGSPSAAALSGIALAAGSLFESFEGTFPPAGWTVAPSTWTQNTFNAYDGTNSAYNYNYGAITDEQMVTPKVSIVTGDELTFYARNSSGSDEMLQIQSSPDKTTWTDIGTVITLTSTWTEYVIDLSALDGGNYHLAFSATSADIYSNYFYVDYVIGPPIFVELPGPAVIGAPADLATNVDITTDLSWSAPITGGIPDGYKLYFGTDGGGLFNPSNIEAGTDQTSPYEPATALLYSTTYYWRVVPYNVLGDAVGSPIWSFETEPDPTLFPPILEEFSPPFPPANYTRYSGLLADPSTLVTTTGGWYGDAWQNVTPTTDSAARLNIWGTSCRYWLVTPPIDLGTTDDYQLEFDLTLGDYGTTNPPDYNGVDDKFAVVISLDGGLTWSSANTLRLWDNAGSPFIYDSIKHVGEKVIIDLASYTDVVHIGFYGESTVSNADNDLMINNMRVRVPPTCADPTELMASTITTNSAILGWTENGPATTWEIEYGVAPYTFTGVANFSTSTNPHSLAGIDPATTYDWKVRADCSAGSYSEWSNTSTFITSCEAYEAPFGENFDGVSTPDLPICWSTHINSTSTYASAQTLSSTSAPSQPNYFRWYNAADAAAELVLISPQLSAAKGLLADKQIKFKAYTSDVVNSNQLVVGTMNDPLDYGTFVPFQTIILTSSFSEYTVNFAGYAGDNDYIAFSPTFGGTYDYIYLDDFVYESCFGPTDILAENITETGADLSWTPQGTATNWDLYIVPGGDPAPDMGTTPTVDDNTTTSYAWAGGVSSSSYDCYVRSDCGADNIDVSFWTGPYTFKTALPTAALPVVEDFEPVKGFNITGNAAGNGTDWVVIDTMSVSPDNAAFNVYAANDENILEMLVQVDLTTVANAQLTFSHIAKTEGGYDDCYVEISTDGGATYAPIPAEHYYGNGFYDGLFDEDAYPEWGTLDTPIVDSMWMQETFGLSAYSTFTDVTFRFRLDADGSAQRAGWMIDDITIEELACPPVSDITLDEVYTTSAILSWISSTGISNVEWDTAGFVQGNGTLIEDIATDQITLSPLMASGTYDVYIQNDCGGIWALYQFTAGCIDCPVGSIAEGEACGDSINNGCIDDVSYTTLVANGQTICGNVWADGSAKDEDIFQLELATGYNKVTVEIAGETDLEFGLVEQTIPGVPGCENTTGSVTNWIYPNDCDTATFEIDIEVAGTYYFYLAPDYTTSNLCPGSRYLATWTVEQLTAPTATINPLALNAIVPELGSDTKDLTIGNTGGFPLEYNADIVYPGTGSLIATPEMLNYGTGTVDATAKTEVSQINMLSGTAGPHGFAKFDLSTVTLPPGTAISGVTLNFYVNSGSATKPFFDINGVNIDPVTAPAADLYNSVVNGTEYFHHNFSPEYAAWSSVELNAAGVADLITNWGSGYFAVGFYEYETFGTYSANIDGWAEANAPYIEISYYTTSMPLGWLELDGGQSTSGTVLGGDPDDVIAVDFDATGLAIGTYNATVDIVTNEPGFTKTLNYSLPVTFIIAPSYTVSGTLTYANSANTVMDLVDVKLMFGATEVDATTTDDLGAFSFTTIDGTFNYEATTTKTRGGTDVGDINLIIDYILGTQLIGLPFEAADVANIVGVMDVQDLNGLLDEILGSNPIWAIPDYLFSNPAVIVAGADLVQDFQSLCSGDPDGSFTPPGFCPAPTALGAINITASSADIQWTSVSGLSNVEYGPTGFVPGTGTAINGVTSPQTITGLDPQTTYDYYVQDDCGGISQSAWVMNSFTTLYDYCNGGPTSTSDSNVEGVDIVGDAGTTISHTGCPAVTYAENLRALSVDVTVGNSYSLDVTFGSCGGNYAGAGEVWIDWNNDDVFDAGESIGFSSGTPGSAPWDTFVTFNFIVPPTATVGTTVMRVMQREGGSIPLDPCGNYSWGSVMDFTVNIQ